MATSTKETYQYQFNTGLIVKFARKEKEEIEGMIIEEKKLMEAEHGEGIIWSDVMIGIRYNRAIRKYFKHNLKNEQ